MKRLYKRNLYCAVVGLLVQLTLVTGCTEKHLPKPGVKNEMAMSQGMAISATTQEGMLVVAAGPGFERSYTWDGARRSVTLWPRWERWHGSLGAYYPGPGEHWVENHGITRGVLEEGQQHFRSIEEALVWINLPQHSDSVYRDDGLMVWWRRNLQRKQLNVEVWQIYIDGKKPTNLPRSQNDKLIVTASG